MAQRGIFFAGRQILIPGAYATYTSLAVSPINVEATNIVALIGKAQGGKPFAPTGIGNGDLDRIKALFRGGDLVDAAELTIYPFGRNVDSNPNPGAQDLILVRVTEALQARSDVKSAGVGAPVVGQAVSRDYGLYTNGIQYEIKDGTAPANVGDPRPVQVGVRYVPLNVNETSPDLGNLFRLSYKGAGNATITVDDTGISAATAAGGWSVEWSNPDIQTISDLASYVASQGANWAISIVGVSADMPAMIVDRGQKVIASNASAIFTGTVGAVAHWINRNSRVLQFVLGASPYAAPVAKTAGYVNLAGGVDGDETIDGWRKAFNALKQQPCYFVVPLITTEDAALESQIRDLAISHVFDMRDPKVRKRRVVYLGHRRGLYGVDAAGAIDTSAVDAIAATLNASPVCFFTPGFTRTVDSGKKDFSSYFLAAMGAGIKAGSRPQRPGTLRKVKLEALEVDLDIPTQEHLIKLGCSYVVAHRDTFRFGIFQTTWIQDSDPVKSEPSLIHIGDTIAATAENVLEEKYGGEAFQGPAQVEQFRADFRDILEEAKAEGMLADGNDPATNEFVPAYRNIRVAYKDKTWSARAVATASEPGLYITIELGFASAAGSTGA